MTHGAKNGWSFSEMIGPLLIYSKTCLKRSLKKEDQLSLDAEQKYCRMLQAEHSAILSTFIKLPLFCLFFSVCLRQVLLY